MITSKDNEKLKTVRKLSARKWREREGMFVSEGEDLLEAGLAAGHEPEFVLASAGSGIAGEEVDPGLLDEVSALGSGTRVIAVWPLPATAGAPSAGSAAFLHGLGDPANVGAIIRSAQALAEGGVVLGEGCADPFGPKAVRASMGAIFSCPIHRGELADTPSPRAAMVAHGGEGLEALLGCATVALGSERDGLPEALIDQCERRITIPLRSGAVESLNVAAAAAITLQRVSSPAVAPTDRIE